MIDVEETNTGLRVVDGAKNEVEIEIEDWVPGGEALEIDRDVEVTVAGSAREIRLPRESLTIESAGTERLRWIQYDDREILPSDEHLLHSDASIRVYLQFVSQFEILTCVDNQVIVTFPSRTSVTFGFASQIDIPAQPLRVPPTKEGLASALSSFSHAHKTETPDRSYPSMRPHPPLLVFDEIGPVDDVLQDNSDSSIVFRTPRSLKSLFIAAPLVYYLGATVEIESRESPLIETQSIQHSFSNLDDLANDVGNLLSRIFYMDCLVRNEGPYGFDIRELDLLDELSLNTRRLYSSSLSKRFEYYLEIPFERIAKELPQWPLVVSIAPTLTNAVAIPHLLDRMAMIFPPASRPVDNQTMVTRSLGDYYRSIKSAGAIEESGTPQLIEPKSQKGAINGWIAPGTPVEAFKCLPEAFSNRLKFLGDPDPLSVTVILNDGEMDAEFSEVVNAYQERSEEFAISVVLRSNLSTGELARTFENKHDFVHYIGHCDPEGLRCHDGNLSSSSLSECNVMAFFLNACRSYNQGLELIRKGSVSGIVTIGDVINDQARKVGSTFARVVGLGYSIEQSLRLSRGHAIMNRQYGIVGDGTQTLTQGQSISPTALSIFKANTDEYLLSSNSCSPKFHGSIYRLRSDSKLGLVGHEFSHSVSKNELKIFLESSDEPVIYDDNLYWPDELLDELF